jgi:quinol monooxygenase YgiN
MGWHFEEEKPRLAMVTFQCQVKRGKTENFLAAANTFVEETRSEPGCLSCACYPDARSKLACQLVMAWRTRADYERFRHSAQAERFLGGPAFALLAKEPRVTVWEAEENDG